VIHSDCGLSRDGATPSMMNRCVSRECGGQPRAHHVIASTRRSRGSVKPVSREADGAKRSGLTELRTAGQSRVVMAAVHATVPVRQRTRNAIDARWWKRRRRRRSSAAAVRIQSVCALNLQNARFRRNLVEARDPVTGAESFSLDGLSETRGPMIGYM